MRKRERKLIHRALDGEASESETRRLQRTLKADQAARAEYEQLRQVVRETRRMGALPPSGDFTRRLLERVDRETRSYRRKTR